MTQYAIPIDVFNAALLRLGELPIQPGDNGAEARIFRGVFEGAARAMLSRHKFGFARKYEQLSYQGLSPRPNHHVYTLPEKVLYVHNVLHSDTSLTDYEVIGRNQIVIRSGLDTVAMQNLDIFAAVCFYADVSNWSDDFAECIVMKMESIILKALLEDQVGSDRMRVAADARLLEVIARDKFQNPAEQWTRPELTPVFGYQNLRLRRRSR